jgi:two-component system, cell cycle sensor histidine kinase and response regulator CckA
VTDAKDRASADPLGGSETILVIDDEETVREVLASILSQCGYSVLLGKDGLEGLEIFTGRRGEIDLVLLDLSMPRMAGRQVLAKILETRPDARVIIQTGYADDVPGLEGAAGIIHKPFQIKNLLATIRAALDA